MQEAEKIIKSAKESMQEMLYSVYSYNSSFIFNEEQEKLLNRILFAMSVIDRSFFYQGEEAYYDTSLPIGEGQTISQPSTVARMLILSDLEQRDNVLEIGTGSGWNAALIAFLCYPGNAISIERLNSLKEKAEKNLSSLRNCLKLKKPEVYEKLQKINFLAENIFQERMTWKKKYDKVIFTAGIVREQEEKIKEIAESLLKQQGRLICPRTSGPLIIYEKQEKGKLKKYETHESYVFVPLLEELLK